MTGHVSARGIAWSRWKGAGRWLAALLFAIGPARALAAPTDSTGSAPQRDVFDVLRSITGKKVANPELTGEFRPGLSWTMLPAIGYNPLYGVSGGLSASGAGRLGSTAETRISRLVTGANYSTTGQFQADLRGSLFLEDNRILWLIDARYLDTSRPTYGLGPAVPDQQKYPIDYKMLRTYLTLLWHVEGAVYAGPGIHYDRFTDIVDERAENGESTPYLDYTGSSSSKARSFGASLNLLADSRDNPVNPRSGYYLGAVFNTFTERLGSDRNWQEVQAEFRAYPPVPAGSRNRLALWALSWMTFGHVPYLNLPHIGGDTYGKTGRGYLQARIRAQDLAYLEAEYRMELTQDGLLGATVFLNATSVAEPVSGVFGRADWGGGTGLRLKFNKRSDTNFTVDFGWGDAGSFNIYAGMGEVF